jgi:hypothetical protein
MIGMMYYSKGDDVGRWDDLMPFCLAGQAVLHVLGERVMLRYLYIVLQEGSKNTTISQVAEMVDVGCRISDVDVGSMFRARFTTLT